MTMSGSVSRPKLHMDMPPEGPKSLPSMVTPRKLGNGRTSPTSPLKLFGLAKKRINDIFGDIAAYVHDSCTFLNEAAKEPELVSDEVSQQVLKYEERVSGIREIIGRDRMKVAFFGRTSNGKSTVINAMLRTTILPSGMGHTTNCFLQVEGTDHQEAYVFDGEHKQPFSTKSITERASAISSLKAESNTLIKICWPKDRCHLLKDDVILVDSPGIDIDPDLDVWIDKFCLDADVFVLVANAESTLMQTEKKFFHKVSERLSKPNIFILNNRWDASVLEPEYMEEVKQQHMERCVHFLVDELKVTDKLNASDRVYFVSAREALLSRLQSGKGQIPGTPGTPGILMPGHLERSMEFEKFEHRFEECISHSAVLTKFDQHTHKGKTITSDLAAILEQVLDSSFEKKTRSSQIYRETQDQLDYIEKQLEMLTNETKDSISQMAEQIEKKVATAFVDEIRRLAILVDEFERPFHPDQVMLNLYKKELHSHLGEALSKRLNEQCSLKLKSAVEAAQCEITDRLSNLLPEESRSVTSTLLPVRDFEPAYRLDCKNLCADFQEDIHFRFSLGITSLMYRFLGPAGTKNVLTGGSNTVPRPLAMTPMTPSNEVGAGQNDQQMLMAMLSQFTGLYSGSAIGSLAVIGVVTKAAGWRVIAVCGTVYGLVYLYEWFTWTNKAKERTFKKQYVEYAAQKLRLIVDLTSSNCSFQVKQELMGTFGRLAHLVDNSKSDLQEKLKALKQDVHKLEEIQSNARVLKNRAGFLDTELNTFIQEYLKPESRL